MQHKENEQITSQTLCHTYRGHIRLASLHQRDTVQEDACAPKNNTRRKDLNIPICGRNIPNEKRILPEVKGENFAP